MLHIRSTPALWERFQAGCLVNTVTAIPQAETRPDEAGAPQSESTHSWEDLGAAKSAVPIALSRATARLPWPGVAKKAGYKPGTLRHHFGELQEWNYIDRTKDGYAITPTGATLVARESV